MDARVPPTLQPLLQGYLSRVQERLPGLLAGFYLYGSIAYEAYDQASSDIDGLALLGRPCGDADLAVLRQIHAEIAAQWPQPRLEVSYVQWAERGRWDSAAPSRALYHHGALREDDRTDPNSPLRTPIGWWQLQQRGIALMGPEASALGLRVTDADLVADSCRLVEAHWALWTRSPRYVLSLRHERAVDWAVLGILRTYYTLSERDVSSKHDAARYALQKLPARWHRLVKETVQVRRQQVRQGLMFRLRTAADAALFMRYMVARCRQLCARPARP